MAAEGSHPKPTPAPCEATHAWLQRKVDQARRSVRAGQGEPNEKFEAEFAARRAQA